MRVTVIAIIFITSLLAPTRPATPLPGPTPARAAQASEAEPSPLLEALYHHYLDTTRANVFTVNERLVVTPSPIYANGIYMRDAFYAVIGLEDLELADQAFRWFETTQIPENGQIQTAVPFDPADQSLQPQDDESTLLFLIWAGMLHREGRPVDAQVVADAWDFVQSHVDGDRYISAPGEFRYWADCWDLAQPDVITYNQGFYALATRFLLEMETPGVSAETAARATEEYRRLYRPAMGFLPLSAWRAGSAMQDVSALLPEFLHRYFFSEGMLFDAAIINSVDHNLATASVYDDSGSLIGIKNLAKANGDFANPSYFACPSLRNAGDYHNGGYWPMYTLVELALAYAIDPQPVYREAMEQLVARELQDGSAKEYWELSPGREGTVHPGRDNYSWNALIVPALRWAGLID